MSQIKLALTTEEGYPIPGTVHLLDLDHSLNVQHGSGSSEVVLVPQPSKDPNDPLNWSNWRKHMTYFWVCWYVFVAAGQSAALSPALLEMQDSTGISLADLNAGTGYLFLFYGLGCLITQPLALAFGRRAVFIVSLLIGGVGCQFWLVACKSSGNYFANRIFTGLFLSPVEALAEIVVTDLYFAHQRGLFMGMYVLALTGSSVFCPLYAGFINENLGWHWIPYIFAIKAAVGVVGSFFFLEEPMYHRKNMESDVLDAPPESKQAAVIETTEFDGADSDYEEYQTKTYLQRLYLWDRKWIRTDLFWPSVYRPVLIIAKFPPVVLSSIILASCLAWFNVLQATYDSTLQAPPYNFGGTGVSLFYLGPTVGCLIASFLGGYVSDRICLYCARRTEGLREPEFRLYAGLICMILNPLGLWLFGIGAAKGLHWFALCFGCGCVGFCINMGAVVPYVYSLDSYKEVGGDAIVSMVLIRNLFGFAFAYAITPWIESQGMQNTFLVVGILSLVFWGISVPLLMFGKKLRYRTAKTYHQYLQKHRHE
uniref:ARAD1D17336p n=1 Tax=Blastobotrys adeninivorans TaxID=409370 RepID=A0A060TAB3_BLAAD